jgi:hypothetical protein
MRTIHRAVVIMVAAMTLIPLNGRAQDERPDITTLNGTTYIRCKISRVEPDGISVFHSKGISKIPFPDLPEEMQKQYNYDPSK